MHRREFLLAWPATSPAAQTDWGTRLPITKGIILDRLPKDLSYTERFKMARDVGFEAMEIKTQPERQEAEEIKRASEASGLPIHSVMNWGAGQVLSSPDPAAVAGAFKTVQTSLSNAVLWDAHGMLLVPSLVTPQTSYQDAWVRSHNQVVKLIPLAAKSDVVLAIENVGNKFLLSPLEFARYVDEFDSPWVRAYFDVGNVIPNGYPQDWIRTLGTRIINLHLKDVRIEKGAKEAAPLREGIVDWQEVYRALKEIGFRGTATVEIAGGDEAYLREVSRRVDLILNGC